MTSYEQAKYNYDGQYLTGIQGVNTGIVVPWGTGTAPSGFLLCNGAAVSRSTYSALFAVIGTTYGSGDGSTTFNVPDLQDRTAVGASVANSKSLAQTIGANTVTPTGNIGGSVAATTLTTNQIPSHTHGVQGYSGGCSPFPTTVQAPAMSQAVGTPQTGQSLAAGGGQSHSHNLSANFVGSASSVLQPSLVLNYIIKT